MTRETLKGSPQRWADENGDWLRKILYQAKTQPLLVAVPVPLFIRPPQRCEIRIKVPITLCAGDVRIGA